MPGLREQDETSSRRTPGPPVFFCPKGNNKHGNDDLPDCASGTAGGGAVAVDEHTIRVDEMFARQLDTEFAPGVRGLLHHPETGVAALSGEAALEAIAGAAASAHGAEGTHAGPGDRPAPAQHSGTADRHAARLGGWHARSIGATRHGRGGRSERRRPHRRPEPGRGGGVAGPGLSAQARPDGGRTNCAIRASAVAGSRRDRRQGPRRPERPLCRRGRGGDPPGRSRRRVGLYDHARPIIDPERQAALDRRFVRAREVAVYRDIDRDLAGIPLDPAAPLGLESLRGTRRRTRPRGRER